jgi:hypothetical protein
VVSCVIVAAIVGMVGGLLPRLGGIALPGMLRGLYSLELVKADDLLRAGKLGAAV